MTLNEYIITNYCNIRNLFTQNLIQQSNWKKQTYLTLSQADVNSNVAKSIQRFISIELFEDGFKCDHQIVWRPKYRNL